jgi:Glycosyltransferase family 87
VASGQQSGRAHGHSARTYQVWTIVGLLALIVWTAWWYISWRRNVLVHVERTWVMGWRFLGLDFLNNYQASRHWLIGGNPYRDAIGDPLERAFCYPPLVLPTFAWCAWFSQQRAMHIFLVALTAITGVGVWCAGRARRELGSEPVPFAALLAAVLYSTPVLYALERGNFDLLVLPPLLLAAWVLRERGWLRDGLAGLCLAYVAGIKIYPAILIFGLIPLRRFRALAFTALAGGLLLSFHPVYYAPFRANAAALVAQSDPRINHFLGWTMHSLSGIWPLLIQPLGLEPLMRLPGIVAACLVLGPILAWTSWKIHGCAEPRRLILPYLLWLTAAASFFPPVANDYSLVFLPLAVVATWDRRDPVWVHLALGLLLLWWQPCQIDAGPRVLLVGKIAGVWAMGMSLMYRTGEQNELAKQENVAETVISLPRAA